MTTLEMLNASKENPGAKFILVHEVYNDGFYYLDGKVYNPENREFHCMADTFLAWTWEREKPKPLRGEIEFEVEFNGYGTVLTGTGVVGRAIREAVTGDSDNVAQVKNKRFRIKGTVEEIA